MSSDKPTTGPADAPEGSEGLILVADDDQITQLFIERLLQQAGYRTEAVADGQAAISALESRRFDLVVMDCHMPVKDGFSATRHIRSGASGKIDPGIPVIALTGSTSEADRLRCLDAGMDACVCKPADPQVLVGEIQKCLGGGAAGEKTAHQAVRQVQPVRDDDFLETLITDFLAELPQLVADLQLAARHGDLAGLKDMAHRLRGPVGILEFSGLSALAKAVEEAGSAGDPARAARLTAELTAELQALAAALQE